MDMNMMAERIALIRNDLAAASEGRYPVPELIAVTKTHTAEEILPLEQLGIKVIGENRVQELMGKIDALEGRFGIHLIGRLQRNKVRYIAGRVDMIQSVDSAELAEEISRRCAALGRVMPVLVEVSPAGEKQKGGVPFSETRPLLETIRRFEGIRVEGLMAVMPQTDDEALLDRLFGETRTLFEHIRDEAPEGVAMRELSMGMSGDYMIAARHGATMVRVGSAVFGPRN
ncbi:MAG: YggS family pyridoxal phosphate-dependent enzyme [Clostridia bacterium]|nr:YggS family pyridoxal phosphate-dependent enzyme [Clostridia bacterium]